MVTRDYNEKDLVKKLVAGSESAFKIIFDKYKHKLYGFCLKITKSEEYAEEIVHDVFMKVWTGRDKIDLELSFNAYLFRIAQNASLNFLKKAAADKALKRKLLTFLENIDNYTENQIISHDYENSLMNAVKSLPPQQQLVFKMSRIEGMTHAEISKSLKISKGTVKNYVMLATQRLTKYLHIHPEKLFILLYFLYLI